MNKLILIMTLVLGISFISCTDNTKEEDLGDPGIIEYDENGMPTNYGNYTRINIDPEILTGEIYLDDYDVFRYDFDIFKYTNLPREYIRDRLWFFVNNKRVGYATTSNKENIKKLYLHSDTINTMAVYYVKRW